MLLTDIFSTGGKVVPAGTVSPIRCPHCGRTVSMEIFRSDHTVRALGVTILRRKTRLFTVCAACGAVERQKT